MSLKHCLPCWPEQHHVILAWRRCADSLVGESIICHVYSFRSFAMVLSCSRQNDETGDRSS